MRTRVPLRQLAVGDVCEGVVTRLERYGFFVDIGTETNGLVHVSEIANGFISNVADYATVGDRVKAKIIDLDTDRRKLSLSVKQVDGLDKKTMKAQRACELGGDYYDPWNDDGNTCWVNLPPRPRQILTIERETVIQGEDL